MNTTNPHSRAVDTDTDEAYPVLPVLRVTMAPDWSDAQRQEADAPFELWDWVDDFFYRIWPAVGWVAVGMALVATLIFASQH